MGSVHLSVGETLLDPAFLFEIEKRVRSAATRLPAIGENFEGYCPFSDRNARSRRELPGAIGP